MSELVTQLVSGAFGVIVALIGVLATRQATKAKRREEELEVVQAREEHTWSRLEKDLLRMEDRVRSLEDGLKRAEERANAAEARAILAERERDRKEDEIRDLNQVIDAFVQDRMDLDIWATDGGQPPVPGAHWRVVQLIEKHTKRKGMKNE